MSDPIDIDPSKPEEQGAAGGAGDDDDISDWKLVPPSPKWEKKVQDQRTHIPIKKFLKKAFISKPFLQKKRKDYLPLQRTLQKPLSLSKTLQGMFLLLQKNWEQWRSSNIFPTWITIKLKYGTYEKKEEG